MLLCSHIDHKDQRKDTNLASLGINAPATRSKFLLPGTLRPGNTWNTRTPGTPGTPGHPSSAFQHLQSEEAVVPTTELQESLEEGRSSSTMNNYLRNRNITIAVWTGTVILAGFGILKALKLNKERIRGEKEEEEGDALINAGSYDNDCVAATWSLPHVNREVHISEVHEILNRYQVSPTRGFLPHSDPLQRLPEKYKQWELLSKDLSGLILARQVRHLLQKLPVIAIDELRTQDQLRRAHLILCCLAHAYVWATSEPADVIPKGVSIPLCATSDKLSLPPILSHTDIVLYNWRKLDSTGSISLDNMTTLAHISGGTDEAWFYEVTVEIEAVGAPAILATLLAQDAIKRLERAKTFSNADKGSLDENCASGEEKEGDLSQETFIEKSSPHTSPEESAKGGTISSRIFVGELTRRAVVLYVIDQLKTVNHSISAMVTSLKKMNQGCMPFIFYHRIRPFLSGWKSNPSLPNGVVYQGVKNDERQFFYGGSAAQSPLLPFLDISLGVSHTNSKSEAFLLAMRDYMLRPHREFLQQQAKVACIRNFVIDALRAHGMDLDTSGDSGSNMVNNMTKGSILDTLRLTFNSCIDSLQQFRDAHMKIVHVYIIAQQKMLDDSNNDSSDSGRQTNIGNHQGMSPPRGDILRTGPTVVSPRQSSGARKFVEAATGDPNIAQSGSDTSLVGAAGGKGTGGTDLMKFLRPIRESVAKTHIP